MQTERGYRRLSRELYRYIEENMSRLTYDHFTGLPDDIKYLVFFSLSGADRKSTSIVCHDWRVIANGILERKRIQKSVCLAQQEIERQFATRCTGHLSCFSRNILECDASELDDKLDYFMLCIKDYTTGQRNALIRNLMEIQRKSSIFKPKLCEKLLPTLSTLYERFFT